LKTKNGKDEDPIHASHSLFSFQRSVLEIGPPPIRGAD